MENELQDKSKFFYKPYKITYIRFTEEFDFRSKNLFYKEINKLEDTDEEINYQKIDEEINILYNNLYNSDKGFQLHCYIFIGKVTDEIEKILVNISIKKNYEDLTKIDIDKLNTYFGYDFFNEININWSKYDNVKFIYSSILGDDSIHSLKLTIFSELSRIIDIEYLLPDNLFLTTFLDNNYMNFLEDTTELTIKPHNKIIQNMFYRMLKKSNKPSNDIFIQELLSIGIDIDNANTLANKYEHENLTYSNICKDKFIYKHIIKFLKNPIISHSFNYYVYNTEVYLDNLIYQYFDLDYKGYDIQLNKGEKNTIRPVNEEKINRLLSSVGRISNKEIYFYSFSNIHSVIKKKNVFDLKIEKNLNKYFNGFISKYFPNIKEDNYQNFLINELKEDSNLKKDFTSIKFVLENKNKLYSLITTNNTFFNIPEININKINNLYTKIKHNLNLHKNINLLDIFNKIKLSLDIPFVKFKDPITKEIFYKIFKEITKKDSNRHISIVGKETLIEWIKVSNYEIDYKQKKMIKTEPKNIEYKIKLGDYKKSNIIFNGIIEKINYSEEKIINLDILDINDNIIIKNIQQKFLVSNIKEQDLIPGAKVEFYKFDTVYGNLEITKNGELFFSVLWNEIYEISYEDVDILLLNKMNNFIDEIKSLDNMEDYKNIILNSNLSIINLNNIFFNTSYLHQNSVINIEIPNDIKLDYDLIRKLGDIYFTHISLNSDIYEKNEEIEYYENSWNNIGYKYQIDQILLNGNYDIYQIDTKSGKKKKIENVNSRYIRNIGNLSNRAYIHFIYRRVDNYSEIPITKEYIHKLYKQNIKKEEILEKTIKKFSLKSDHAQQLINEEINSIIDKKSKKNTGIDIKIDYLTPIKIEDSINIYKIYIEGYSNILELNNIKNFIDCFFKTYILLHSNLPKYQSNYQIFRKLYNEFFEQFEDKKILNTLIDNNSNIEQNEKVHEEEKKDFKILIDFFDSDSEDEDDTDEGQQLNISELSEEKIDDKEDIIEKKDDDKDLVQSGNSKEVNNPILQRLYDRDIKLFRWSNKDVNYARSCQKKRQPIVISDEEKNIIDEQHPNSYNGYNKGLSCTKENILGNPLLEDNIDSINCTALRWGSSPENQNWYICPRIFDLENNVSLNTTDFKYLGLGKNQTDTEEDIANAKIKYGKNYGVQFKSKNIYSRDWRISVDLKDDTSGIIINPDILDFTPIYKGKPVKELLDSNKIRMMEDNNYIYPGFNDGPPDSNIYVPCCFLKPGNKIGRVFGINENTGEINENYVQGFNKKLGEDRKGILKYPFPDIFFNENNLCVKGTFDETKSCYLRQGINISPNSFFSLIGSYKDRKETDIQVIDYIIKNINEQKFKTLNNGNLEILFRDNLSQPPYNISSFQNYLEYILSDENKHHQYFLDFLTRPNSYFDKNGLILIIIEEKDNKFNILCPYFMDNNWYENIDADISIALKIGTIYEPIFYFDKSKIPVKRFKKTNTVINNLFKLLIEKCTIMSQSDQPKINPISNKEILDQSYNLYDEIIPELTKVEKYSIRKYLIDDYNKIIGVYLANKLIIPCKPFVHIGLANSIEEKADIIKLKPGTHYFNINAEIDEEHLETPYMIYNNFLELNKNTKLNIRVIRKIIDNNDNIVGLELGSGHIVPVKKEKNKNTNNQIYDNMETFKGYHNFDKKLIEYQRYTSNKFFKKKINFNSLIEILRKIDNNYFRLKEGINKLYTNDDKLLGLILEKDLLLEIEPIELKNLPDNILIWSEETGQNIKLKELPISSSSVIVSNYEIALNKYFDLWKNSNYQINIKPIKNIVNNNKEIIGFILEQGQIVNLDPKKYPTINQKNTNKEYLINSILDTDFYTRIDEIKPSLYESIYIDDRIRYMKKLNYKNMIYKLIKKSISKFIKKYPNLKNYFNQELTSKTNTLKYKRIYIEYILKILFSIHGYSEDITEENFNKKELNYKSDCPEIKNIPDCENNDLCINNSLQVVNNIDIIYIKKNPDTGLFYNKEDERENTRQNIFIEMWKKIYETESSIVNDNSQLKLYLKQNNISINEKDEENIINFYNHIYAIKKQDTDIIIVNLLKKTIEIENIIYEIKDDIKYGNCKYIIYNIIKDGLLANDKSLYDIFINYFSEELIRNKYKRKLIIENILIDEGQPEYYVNEPYEILINHSDLIASEITNLYLKIRKNYFKKLNLFDESDPKPINTLKENSINLDRTVINKKDSCIVKRLDKNIKYNIHIDKLKLNKNKSTEGARINLDLNSYNEIKDYLDKKNAYERCSIIKSPQKLKYILKSAKKKLL